MSLELKPVEKSFHGAHSMLRKSDRRIHECAAVLQEISIVWPESVNCVTTCQASVGELIVRTSNSLARKT